MDYTAIYDFLTYLYVPTPKTLYLNVNKLEPGKFLSIDVNSLNISKHSYWKLKVQNLKLSYKEAKDHVFDIILRNVEQQMMSDVDVGFFLSGGVDSSAIVCGCKAKL